MALRCSLPSAKGFGSSRIHLKQAGLFPKEQETYSSKLVDHLIAPHSSRPACRVLDSRVCVPVCLRVGLSAVCPCPCLRLSFSRSLLLCLSIPHPPSPPPPSSSPPYLSPVLLCHSTPVKLHGTTFASARAPPTSRSLRDSDSSRKLVFHWRAQDARGPRAQAQH